MQSCSLGWYINTIINGEAGGGIGGVGSVGGVGVW
jgi:hypothetical protein